MNRIILLLLLMGILGCSGQKDRQEQANAALIDRYINAVENLEYKVMEELLAEEYLGVGPSHNDSIDKITAVESWKKNVENLYQSIHYSKLRTLPVTIESGENKGEWVSSWAQLEITYKEDGKKAIIMSNTVYQIENDQIIKSYTFYNEADVLEQLGFVFIDPNDL